MANEDFGAYQSPGVFVSELQTPVINVAGVAPSVVGIVGDTQRYREHVEIVQLNDTTSVQLSKLGIDEATIVVSDRFTGTVFVDTTDYTVTTGTGADAVADTVDDTTTLVRVDTGDITDGGFVTVTYRYTDAAFYTLGTYSDYNAVRETYGPPLLNGAINSEVTLGAFFAFLNGAPRVVVSPVQAAVAQPTTEEWGTAIDALKDESSVNIVVPMSGSTAIHDLTNAHCTLMSNLNSLRRCFLGRSSSASLTDLISQATGYSDSRVTLVGPSAVRFYEGDTRTILELDSYYLAAATAGLHASQSVHVPITNKVVKGFSGFTTQSATSDMDAAQRQGVTMVYQRRDGAMRVRHGLTTDTSNAYTKEINIQAAKDRLITFIEETLVNANVIGSVFTDNTRAIVTSTVVGVLRNSTESGLIAGFTGVESRRSPDDPTLLQIRFMYQPSLPLNYVEVVFALDTNTGSVQFELANAA